MNIYKKLSQKDRKHLLHDLYNYHLDEDGTIWDEDGDELNIKTDEHGKQIGRFETLEDFFNYQHQRSFIDGLRTGKWRLQQKLKNLIFQ